LRLLSYIMVDEEDRKHDKDMSSDLAGDEALRTITRLLEENVRDVDFTA